MDPPHAESALLDTSAALSLAEQLAGLGSWTRDLSSSAPRWSDGLFRLLGLAPGAIVPSYDTYLAYLHPDDLPIERAGRARILTHGSYESSVRIRRADGVVRHVVNRGVLVRDAQGSPIRVHGTVLDVTELRRTEDALRQSEQRFRDLAEAASDWIWETDANHCFTVIVGGSGGIAPHAVREALGRTLWQFAGGDPKVPAWAAHIADLEGRRAFRDFRYSCRASEGTTRHYRVSGKPHFSDDGTFRGYRGVATDETQFVDAERRAGEAQARLADALDSVPEAIVLLDRDDRLLAWNRHFADDACRFGTNLLRQGLPYPEVIGARVSRGLHRSGAVDIDAIVGSEASLLRNAPAVVEEQLSDGTWRRTVARRTHDGGTIVMCSDITERRRRDTEVRKLSAAIEQSASGIAIIRIDGTFEYANQKWSEITGYSPAEAIGRTPAMLGSGSTPVTTYKELWESLLAGRSWVGEILNRRKNGDLYWCREVLSPLRDADGRITHFVAVEEDVTERRRADEELRQSKAQAEAANRAKTQFLANMSHELRTPLNAIIGFSEMIRSGTFGPLENPRYRGYVEDIFESGRHLLGLINDILDVARIEAVGLSLEEDTVNLLDLCNTARRMVADRAAMDGISLDVEAERGLPLLRGDARLLLQTVLNLATNAVKFTRRGGSVSIRAGQDTAGALWLSCSDTGIGMEPQHLERVFEPFFQADLSDARRHQGAGLGLSLCKSFIDAHGGHIGIDSVLDQGTTVTIRFPLERALKPNEP